MARFIIYTYQFAPLQNVTAPSLFESTENILPVQERMEQKQTIFQQVFSLPPDKIFSKGSKKYDARILFNQGNIVVLRLANSKRMALEESFQIKEHQYAPSCLVIIDNRKDAQQIAIEEDHKAFSDTNVVKSILESSFKKFLKPRGLTVTIQREYKKSEFWKIVNTHQDKITMVRFHFAYPNLPRVRESVKEVFAEANKLTNSKHSSFELKAADGESRELESTNDTLNAIVECSAASGEVIDIKARGLKSFIKTGTTVRSFECDDLEAHLSSDLINSAIDKIVSLFKR